jgi:hypothetical protein
MGSGLEKFRHLSLFESAAGGWVWGRLRTRARTSIVAGYLRLDCLVAGDLILLDLVPPCRLVVDIGQSLHLRCVDIKKFPCGELG